MPTSGSLADFMTALAGLHQQVADSLSTSLQDTVRVYRWAPVTPELPAIYPWIAPSPVAPTGVSGAGIRVSDTLNIRARVATQHADDGEDGDTLEVIIDAYRDIVDAALAIPSQSPFLGIAKVVARTGMQNIIARFNDIPALCMEFSIEATLDRTVSPS